VARRILWASLALTPIAVVARFGLHAGATTLFVLAALALLPLAWLIGEATEHAAEHTGDGVGGFLNASFGNAPELIIALFAIADGLPNVVRGTITGSVVSNILLVLGIAMIFGGEGKVDARSLRWQLFAVLGAMLLLLVPSIPRWTGGVERHTLFLITLPVAVVLLASYVYITGRNLRIHRETDRKVPSAHAWSLRKSLIWLTAATIATAVISEILVNSLEAFGHAVGLHEFFIAAVIVAIVGNAAEHGGAVVIARAGKMKLASEIALSSSAQVALLVTPAVMLLSLLFSHSLPLTFRWEEAVAMAAAVVLTVLVVRDGRTNRRGGVVLVVAYALVVVGFLFAGNR